MRVVQAIGIMNAVLEKYGTYESFEATNGGKLLSKSQIWSIIRKYMQKEGCSGEVSARPFTPSQKIKALGIALEEAQLELATLTLLASLHFCISIGDFSAANRLLVDIGTDLLFCVPRCLHSRQCPFGYELAGNQI